MSHLSLTKSWSTCGTGDSGGSGLYLRLYVSDCASFFCCFVESRAVFSMPYNGGVIAVFSAVCLFVIVLSLLSILILAVSVEIVKIFCGGGGVTCGGGGVTLAPFSFDNKLVLFVEGCGFVVVVVEV